MSQHRLLMGMFVAGTAAAAGCAYDEGVQPLSYDEFKAQAYQEPDTGFFIVNGDEVVHTEEDLKAVYGGYLETVERVNNPGYGTTRQPLIVNSAGIWDRTAAVNLTYCVSTLGFGLDYATVVAAMNTAAAAWEAAGRVNFTHNIAQDVLCNASNTSVAFDVSRVCGTSFYARAFFPGNARAARNVLIDCQALKNIAPLTLAGVLRHELGHVIGFRHEHTRPESGTCFEDNNWIVVTPYDAKSVMHYPHCNGTQTGDLVLTATDIAGTGAVYPP